MTTPRLFDFEISSYITPRAVRSGYPWTVLGLAIATVAGCFVASKAGLGLWVWAAAPFLFLSWVTAARLAAEFLLVQFDAAEDIRRLVERRDGAAGGPGEPGLGDQRYLAEILSRLDAIAVSTHAAAAGVAQRPPARSTTEPVTLAEAAEIVATAETLQKKAAHARLWAESLSGKARVAALRDAADQAEVAEAAMRLARQTIADAEDTTNR